MSNYASGSVFIGNDVVDTIIAMTAYSVDDVLEVKGFDGVHGQLRYGHGRFIKTETGEGSLSAQLTLVVDREANILKVVHKVQEDISNTVEIMLGLKCERVDINVE
jgi:uncharacterized alkaline shock family protein YloU